MGLTDLQQAAAVFFGFLLSGLSGWAATGFPTDKLAVGALVAFIIAGAILALKEWAGVTAPAPPTIPSKNTTSFSAVQVNANYAKLGAYLTRPYYLIR